MIGTDIIVLSQYLQKGYQLKTRDTAKAIWAEERLAERGCLRVDFSKLEAKDLSSDFLREFFRLDLPECRVVWLSPINYSPEIARMLGGYFFKLKKMREAAIKEGFVKAKLWFEAEPAAEAEQKNPTDPAA